ncbi:uncharacterized protein LOC118203169 isoform X2 [Stegodyphus dumicola]|uniref:uncharacterized protein LOC118203169 isoform X2 n=1 Tax=Stegodyphus dumicola TaxID=202533 RepID=UPI0015B13BAE|nr:uncharacterized protein LOC118203169 isoform X2 [Stegodyphus dumicola]
MTGRKDQLSVLLSGGFPWGFRLQGGAGTGLPLVVSKVRRKSKAYKRLCEGDLILSVNGKSCQNLTYDQVMEIADKSGTDLTLQVLRQESDKENLAPQLPASSEAVKEPLHSVTKLENGSLTNEVLSVKETSTKITKETEGMRIKSAVLLPDIDFAATHKILENFTSTKLLEDKDETAEKEVTSTEPFPPFSELLQTSQGPPKPPRSPIDLSTSSKTEEVSQDDNTYIKTTTERKHEVVGNKEISYVKQEQESVSKSSTSPVPDITLDTIDLNNLISATQKRLDSFKNGFAQETPTVSDALSSTYEIKKTEISSSTALTSESKTTEVTNSVDQSTDSTLQDIVVDFKKNDTGKKIPPPPPPKPKIRPLSESYAQTFKDCLKEMEMSEEQIMSSTLPKPKVRPLSESFAGNLKDCLKELETVRKTMSVLSGLPLMV